MAFLRVLPAGDRALSVELGDEISVEVNTRVRALEYLIQQKGLPGVVETVPTFRAVLVYYDPALTGFEALREALAPLAEQADPSLLPPGRTVELPCCYTDPELGFDLVAAAERLGLTPDELVREHAGAEYVVFFMGFTPGLPYMAGLPERLTIPRLATPRTKTPPGSVSIGGTQCCIYPVDSPGGFWVLGRTPVPLYDPHAADPILLKPGDEVRFRAIDRGEFDAIAEAHAAADHPLVTSPSLGDGAPAIRILDAGPLTTIQDGGRAGQLRYGIPPSGPVDQRAFVIANRLVGNADGAAGLECTLIGPRFEAQAPCAIAVTGAAMPITVNGHEAPAWTTLTLAAGDVVKLGPTRAGVRAYLALSGGVDVPPVLGSRATYLRGRLGGLDGRAVRRGDVLALFPAPLPRRRTADPRAIADLTSEPEIRVVMGPQADRFTDAGAAALLSGTYEMLPQSDRMGARLRGPQVEHARGHDIISDGIAAGSIQVPGDGQPIVLLVDRQTAGGYTKIATVCSFDIGRVGQVKPGQRLTFRAIEVTEAHRLLREEAATLARAVREDKS